MLLQNNEAVIIRCSVIISSLGKTNTSQYVKDSSLQQIHSVLEMYNFPVKEEQSFLHSRWIKWGSHSLQTLCKLWENPKLHLVLSLVFFVCVTIWTRHCVLFINKDMLVTWLKGEVWNIFLLTGPQQLLKKVTQKSLREFNISNVTIEYLRRSFEICQIILHWFFFLCLLVFILWQYGSFSSYLVRRLMY